jgi:hypothetical protein
MNIDFLNPANLWSLLHLLRQAQHRPFAMTMPASVRHGHCEPPFGGEAIPKAYWYLKHASICCDLLNKKTDFFKSC